MTERLLNPLQLAAALHWDPQDAAAARAPEAKCVVDYWLQQIEHFDVIFAPEYVEGPALLSELFIEEEDHRGRVVRVGGDERFHHWGLCQHLLAESQRAMASSGVLSRDLTELAVAVATRLDPRHYHANWTEDLRAKAWCMHADACRRVDQKAAARSALNEAQRHARAGTGSAEVAARIHKTEASLSWRTERTSPWPQGSDLPTPLPVAARRDDPSSHSRFV